MSSNAASPKNSLPEHEATANELAANELAALYALDALDVTERDQVRQEIARSPEFAQTVDEFSCTVGALPYDLPPVPLSESLKGRLFQRIAQEAVASDSELYQLLQLSIDELIKKSESLTWEPLAGGTTKAQMAVLGVDEVHQELAFFVKAEHGGHFPLHAHDSGETVLVLAGDFIVEGLTHTTGDRIRSTANTAHQPETHNGCLLFCISSLHDEMLAL
ncbi:MAG: cupin domain-containing protein [Cyanobacteria bacterium J06635_11]